MPIERINHVEIFVGMPFETAKNEIMAHGYEARLVHADGRTIVPDYKPDYDPLRVNLHTVKGKVVKATIG